MGYAYSSFVRGYLHITVLCRVSMHRSTGTVHRRRLHLLFHDSSEVTHAQGQRTVFPNRFVRERTHFGRVVKEGGQGNRFCTVKLLTADEIPAMRAPRPYCSIQLTVTSLSECTPSRDGGYVPQGTGARPCWSERWASSSNRSRLCHRGPWCYKDEGGGGEKQGRA
jgi:hypothetical protein